MGNTTCKQCENITGQGTNQISLVKQDGVTQFDRELITTKISNVDMKMLMMRFPKLSTIVPYSLPPVLGGYVVVDTIEDLFTDQSRTTYTHLTPFNFESLPFKSNLQFSVLLYNSTDRVYYSGQVGYRGKEGWGRMLIETEGSLYEGTFSENHANGYGRIVYGSGDVYEGEWKEKKINGFGKYTSFSGAIYEGEWVNDKQQGSGTETWKDGSKYIGEYRNGLKEGKGTFNWADG